MTLSLLRSDLALPAFLALILLPSQGQSQNVVVDEGAFRILLQGEIVGREEFSIRRLGVGTDARVILRGSVELDLPGGRSNLAPAMELSGGDLSPAAYQLKVTGTRTEEVYVSRSGRRFLAKSLSPEGEQVREYRAGPGSILLDPYVAHQYHQLVPFLSRDSDTSLTVLSPRTGEQIRMTLRRVGEEEVRVGTDLILGSHLRLEGEGSARDIWFDDRGRILRVAIPGQGYVAERESLG